MLKLRGMENCKERVTARKVWGQVEWQFCRHCRRGGAGDLLNYGDFQFWCLPPPSPPAPCTIMCHTRKSRSKLSGVDNHIVVQVLSSPRVHCSGGQPGEQKTKRRYLSISSIESDKWKRREWMVAPGRSTLVSFFVSLLSSVLPCPTSSL